MSQINNVNDLRKMIDINTPIIYINDYDFVRVDGLITEVVGAGNENIYEWNPAIGAVNFFTKEPLGGSENNSLREFLHTNFCEFTSYPEETFIVLKEVHSYLADDHDPITKSLLSFIAQSKLYGEGYEVVVIIVSSVLNIPPELEKFTSVLEIDVLGENDEEEINRIIDHHVEINGFKDKFDDKVRLELMPILKGMTPFEIDRILSRAMSDNGSLEYKDKDLILRQKKQMVKKSGLLELIDTPKSLDSIGGLKALKEYLTNKEKVISDIANAKEFGVSTPKGVFIVGMPGCGKSLCAKASAALFNAPLLKLDMGSMMGKYVGESEANLRKALKIAEAAAPCILWIDEIEKGFAGVSGGGGGNSEILMRMFGYLLSWLQDKEACVYVIATANSADNLPPELKRKGRFDEIFCVNLPNEEERKAIFEVHLKNKKCAKSLVVDKKVIDITHGFNGADIEAVVNDAVEDCFLNKKTFTSELLVEHAEKTLSISKSCKTQIEKMKKIFMECSFTDASTGLPTTKDDR